MTDQVRRTWVLLDTLLDYLPGPQMMRSAASDDAPAAGRSRVYTMAELDRQLAHLEHQARLRAGDYSRMGSTPVEHARIEQYRQGDYAALDLAMMELEVVNALWSGLAWRVAHHHPAVLDVALRGELVRSIVWLAERLPNPAKVPPWTQSAAPPTALHIAALRELGVPYAVMVRVYGEGVGVLRRKAKTRAKEIA